MVSVSCLPILGKQIIHSLAIFFLWRISSFLQGFLAKTGERTWFFDGEFVVECWSNVVL
jgi:hypothetical protein